MRLKVSAEVYTVVPFADCMDVVEVPNFGHMIEEEEVLVVVVAVAVVGPIVTDLVVVEPVDADRNYWDNGYGKEDEIVTMNLM
jgi:hypothetical protein